TYYVSFFFSSRRRHTRFSRDWSSDVCSSDLKKNPELDDIHIGGISLKWNSVANDWVNSLNAPNEVGCIHTTQGYDLNYTGIIFRSEERRVGKERRSMRCAHHCTRDTNTTLDN